MHYWPKIIIILYLSLVKKRTNLPILRKDFIIGGIIAVISIAVRKEWLIPLICGIFLIENLSVIIQVLYFKYTRKKFGIGKRIFLMSPLHHHFQKKGYHESKIVTRFWIVGIFLAILSIITLKIR